MLTLTQIERLAVAFEQSSPATFSTSFRMEFDTYVNTLFRKIPVPVQFVHTGQPFQTSGEQWNFVRLKGYLPIYAAPSLILGQTYAKHRAVHDWFGHIVPELPFGVEGELAAYHIHARQYPARFHSIIFSDVVLANAYFEARGSWFPSEKYVNVHPVDTLKEVSK